MTSAATAARVTAVVVTHDSACDVTELLPRLADPRVQVVVVDNASRDTSAAIAQRHGVDVMALPLNVGWARGCNIGAGRAIAPVVAFVNPDACPTGDDLVQLAERLDDDGVGAVSPAFTNTDGTPQSFYFRFPDPVSGLFCFLSAGQRLDQLLGFPFLRRRTYDFRTRDIDTVDQPGAACLLVRTDVFRELGGFADDLFLFFADTDFCHRLRSRGKRVDVAWDVRVVHRGGGSVRQLPDDSVRRHLQRDYLVYVRHRHGVVAATATRLGVVVLTGIVPMLNRLLRGRWREAVAQLALAARVLR